MQQRQRISIHVLHVEDDKSASDRIFCTAISIHVLHVEDDFSLPLMVPSTPNFNPRPPCGGRRVPRDGRNGHSRFQSTSSMWRTTSAHSKGRNQRPISIHVLHVEDDDFYRVIGFGAVNFNPRPPCGGRRIQRQDRQGHYDFNPRPPCGGRRSDIFPIPRFCLFQSTSSMWRTTHLDVNPRHIGPISIHVLHVEDDLGNKGHVLVSLISIHVLHVEDDHR